ncbi:ptprf [Symbiodinium sp. CCMP2592]|nr:ptprf [Symbiodinium sp. CCMP2592]
MEVPTASRAAIVLDEDFDVDVPLKIVGLKAASHLNEKTCYIHKFNNETQRYEVKLVESNQIKSVQPANLQPLSGVDEVAAWAQLLQRQDLVAQEGLVPLNRLEKLQITIEILTQTNVGKIVNDFAKRFIQSDASVKARQLVSTWRVNFAKQKEEVEKSASGKGQGQAGQSGHRRKLGPVGPNGRPRDSKAKPTSTSANTSAAPAGPGATRASAKASAGAKDGATATSVPVPVKKMSCPQDAKGLLEAMRAANTAEARLATLAALDQSPKHCMRQFVDDGGLEILDFWLRKNPEARHTCLLVLQRLPVALHSLQKSKLITSVTGIFDQEVEKENSKQAEALLARWRSAGFLPRLPEERQTTPNGRLPGTEAAPAAPAAPVPLLPVTVRPEVKESQDSEPAPREVPAPRTPPLSELPAARPESIPPELRNLDPRIALVLMENPDMLEFLKKHPSVFANMNVDSLAYIGRNLKNARSSLQAQDSSDATGRTVTISNLTELTTETDIVNFFAAVQLTAEKVDLPRESRRKRPCGTAFVVLPSSEQALLAVSTLNGQLLNGKSVPVELVDGSLDDGGQGERRSGEGEGGDGPSQRGSKRVRWRDDDELWQVVVFSTKEKVHDLKQRMEKQDFAAPSAKAAKHSRTATASFEAARRVDMELERRHAPKALASNVYVSLAAG